jgi:hypothetical protein
LYRTTARLLQREPFDALFIAIFPTYPALLGTLFKRRIGIPVVLDYIDPWVGAWGLTVGGGRNGAPDFKSRLSRQLGILFEPLALRGADAITAVSRLTYMQILDRNPDQSSKVCAEIPYGAESADFEYLRNHPRRNAYFDPRDGNCHVCYLGTLLPLGFETLRAVFTAVSLIRQELPEQYARLRLHFFGTSNQNDADAPERVMPVARELGVAEQVTEVPRRIDYLDALTVQTQASAILMMGSSERHYTASKLYPGLLAKRPILAVYHEESSVSQILSRVARPPMVRLVTYGDQERAATKIPEIASQLRALLEDTTAGEQHLNLDIMAAYSAQSLTGKLARVLDTITSVRNSLALLLIAMLSIAGVSCATSSSTKPTAATAGLTASRSFEAISLLGDTFGTLKLPGTIRARYEQQLAAARANLARRPDRPDALI